MVPEGFFTALMVLEKPWGGLFSYRALGVFLERLYLQSALRDMLGLTYIGFGELSERSSQALVVLGFLALREVFQHS